MEHSTNLRWEASRLTTQNSLARTSIDNDLADLSGVEVANKHLPRYYCRDGKRI